MRLQRTVPVLRMLDVAKAREFYLDFLGFSVLFEARFSDNAPLFMGVARDDVTFFLSEHHGDGTPGANVAVEMEGIADLHRELNAKNYRYMKPHIIDQEWGWREMYVIDPFGNRVIFRERIAAN